MKWRLTIGLVLLIIGCIFVLLPPNIFNPFMSLVNLSETTYNSTTLVPPGKLYTVPDPPSSLNLPFSMHKGFSVVGNFTVVTGSTVSLLGFDSKEFSSWSVNNSGVPLFYTISSRNDTFLFKINQDDTYYFVFVKSEEGKSTIILLSLDLVEEKSNPSIFAYMIGPILIAFGAIITLFRISPDILQPRIERKEQEYAQMKVAIQVAKTLGISVKGKTIEQIRQDIKDYMDKEKQSKV